MLTRRCVRAGFGGLAVVVALAACQSFPAGGGTSTATPQPAAAVSSTASLFDNVVWARIPYCGCLDGKATDNVAAALDRVQLAGTVKELNPTDGWMYFVVAFDPATASQDQISAAIVAGGGEVVAGPP